MTTEELVKRVRDNPRTTAWGITTGGLYLVGDYLHGAGIEPFGAIVLGVAGVVGTIALFLARDPKPKE